MNKYQLCTCSKWDKCLINVFHNDSSPCFYYLVSHINAIVRCSVHFQCPNSKSTLSISQLTSRLIISIVSYSFFKFTQTKCTGIVQECLKKTRVTISETVLWRSTFISVTPNSKSLKLDQWRRDFPSASTRYRSQLQLLKPTSETFQVTYIHKSLIALCVYVVAFWLSK